MGSTASELAPRRELATPGKRFVAVLIDAALIGVVLPIPFLGPLVGVAYGLVKDALPFLDGQSIGKRAMGIRAIKEATGENLTGDYPTAIVRQASLLIPFFNIVDAFMVFSETRKRFGDQWAKTVVVVEGK